MRIAAILLLAAVSSAQDHTPASDRKRLESVTWDLKSHKLVWVVQEGAVENGKFNATSSRKYEISPDRAVMAFADEKRGFTKQEAAVLHKLLDTLSVYCAESVEWWDQGKGVKLDQNEEEAPKPKKKTPTTTTVDFVAKRR